MIKVKTRTEKIKNLKKDFLKRVSGNFDEDEVSKEIDDLANSKIKVYNFLSNKEAAELYYEALQKKRQEILNRKKAGLKRRFKTEAFNQSQETTEAKIKLLKNAKSEQFDFISNQEAAELYQQTLNEIINLKQ